MFTVVVAACQRARQAGGVFPFALQRNDAIMRLRKIEKLRLNRICILMVNHLIFCSKKNIKKMRLTSSWKSIALLKSQIRLFSILHRMMSIHL